MQKTDWLIILLVFNFLAITFMGYYGDYLQKADLVEVQEVDNSLIKDIGLDIVTGFSESPAWLNGLLTLQLIVAIYILIATVFGA